MKITLTQNWKNRRKGDTVEGREAVEALNEKAAQLEGRKPVERAEKRPAPDAERR
jgi:hypothetical protein